MKEMKENDKWIEAIKKKLEDYTEPTPTSGWEQLERELMPPVEKRIYPYRRWAVAAAAVVLVVATSVSLYFLDTPTADEMRHTPTLATVPDLLPEPALPDVKVSTITPAKPLDVSVAKGSCVLAQGEKKTMPVAVDEAKRPEAVNETSVATPETMEKAEQRVEPVQQKQEARRPSGRDKFHLSDERSATRQKGKWSMGVSVGNGGSISSPGGGNFNYMSTQRINLSAMTNNAIPIPGDKELVFEDGVPYLRESREIPKIEHHLPVTFGLSVRKSLPKGFSVETGLNYTLLSSDITMEGTDQMESQKLHYLGIPLRANWNFYDKKRFTLYVSGGGMVEKCVYGKVAGEELEVKPLQFSVMGAVGAQFNANQHIGVYVEPGVSYFFDDGSSVQTIRKETPLNFNLQAGIRFTY